MRQRLLLATNNQGKIEEYCELLEDLSIEYLNLSDVNIDMIVDESGSSFEENAILKATQYAAVANLMTLADDSGLEVDALGGKPGVHTARYGGTGLTPAERYLLLLEEMQGIEWSMRTARFHCVIALAHRRGLIGIARGVCEGFIADKPSGKGGFGYDPVFYLPALGKTMAQLTSGEKHKISHRGKALRKVRPLIERALSDLNSV